ncbi:MAG: hypothetical protein HY608_07620, partial [Planctomycetes bacterium]|nr:hypothetical protein [Planctomycetota bacterium]
MRVRFPRRTGSASPSGPALTLRVPVGESAADPIHSSGVSDSTLKMYALERQHLAAQGTALEGASARNGAPFAGDGERPSVRIRMSLDEKGRPTAVAGEASTVARNAAGRDVVLREFATASGASSPLVDAPSRAFGEGTRGIPQFEILDAFLSRLRIARSSDEIRERTAPGSLRTLRDSVRSVREVQRSLLGDLRGALEAMHKAAARLADPKALRDDTVGVEGGSVLEASVAGEPKTGASRVSVLRLSREERIASDPVADPDDALGKSGNFLLGGVEVPVVATDSLFDLALRITRGEDTNGNGVLDHAEDRNFSRTLDPREDTNGNGRLDRDEDLNGNGVFDAGEDFNGNGILDLTEDLNLDFHLDGGVSRHGVRAFIEDNRLILAVASAGTKGISLSDPDGILAGLGVVRTNVHVEIEPVHPVQDGRTALVQVDGKDRTVEGNVVQGLREGIDATLRHEGLARVTVGRDVEVAVDRIASLVESFNEALRSANRLLDAGGLLRGEDEFARRRQDLVRHADGNADALRSRGIAVWGRVEGISLSTGRAAFHELSVDAAVLRV